MFTLVVDRETGEEVRLDWTDELRAELAQHDNEECTHTEAQVRWFRASNGAIHYKKQCLECGELLGQAVRKVDAPANCSQKDENLFRSYHEIRRARRDEILQRYLLKQKSQDSAFWKKYTAYLKTTEWRDLANRVLTRAHGICEGCGRARATQVHHRTYEHVFEEFLFELTAVCDACHKRLHPERFAATDEWRDDFPCSGYRFQAEKDHWR